jgi:hypothetical protein
MQEALSGKRLPTLQVTLAIARACAADGEAWRTYWGQVKRATDRDAPEGDGTVIVPPWVRTVEPAADVTSTDQAGGVVDTLPRPPLNKRRRLVVVGLSAGVFVLGVALGLVMALLGTPRQSATFPSPSQHPVAPAIKAVTRTYTEQEFNQNGAPTFLYLDGSGAGVPVAYGQFVQVSCKVYSTIIKSTKPDGYWYRLASPPWYNHYYAVANTFGNGDKLGGPYTHNTDFKVPNC